MDFWYLSFVSTHLNTVILQNFIDLLFIEISVQFWIHQREYLGNLLVRLEHTEIFPLEREDGPPASLYEQSSALGLHSWTDDLP